MMELLVRAGVLVSLAATLLAAVTGLRARSPRDRRVSHLVLAVAGAVGLAAAITFLAAGLPPLALLSSPLLFGAPLAVDRLSAFFLVVLHLVSLLTTWFGATYTEREREKYPPRAVLPLTGVFLFGMQGVLLSSGLASFLLFWEAMSISSFFLVMADGEDDSRAAALLYLAVAQFGAGALLIAIGLLAGGNVRADFAGLPAAMSGLDTGQQTLAIVLVLFAFASKAGLAPLHAWLPEAHPRAPSHVSALMSGVMLKVAVYGLLRFMSVCWPALPGAWGIGLLALGLGGAAVAVIYANLARDFKRVLAWSSVENVGLIFTMLGFSILLRSRGLAALADAALGAMFLHVLAHALFKSGLFLGAGAIVGATHTGKIEFLGGLANRMPRLSAGMLALSLAAAALPPFGPFVAEWRLIQAVLSALSSRSAAVLVTSVAVLAGVAFVAGLAVFAMIRLFAFVFLAEPRSDAARQASEPAPGLGGPLHRGRRARAGPRCPVAVGRAAAAGAVVRGAGHLARRGASGEWSPAGVLPFALGLALAAALAVAWLAHGVTRVRRYHTWDCGQPIDASMEYTATAFSAPVRHFLRDIVRAEKHVVFQPVLASNPWIRRGHMEFRKAAGLLERVYYPIAQLIEGVGARLKQLQNGVIQFYIALILAALLFTLWVAL